MLFTPRAATTKARTARTTAEARRRSRPALEAMEDRRLMTAGAGFLTGTVFLDSAATGALDPADAYVAGATVQLYRAGASTPLATQLSGANGQYLFTGLAAGKYQLKEVPPAGYRATAAQTLSQLNPASAAGADAINVTVADPSKVFVNYGGIASGTYAEATLTIDGQASGNTIGTQQDTLGTSAGATDLNAGFLTYCVNDLQNLSNITGGDQYQVTPRPSSALNNNGATISADHAGRIAYLFNHYGTATLSNVQGAGLQLAIWELLYDNGSTADFTAGDFQVTSAYAPYTTPATLAAIEAQATTYFNASAGKSETAAFLDAAVANPGVINGLQSVLATDSLNFGVAKVGGSATCEVDNVQYVVNGGAPLNGLGGNVHAGDTVQVDFTVPAGMTETLSLASYITPQNHFDAKTAFLQLVYQSQTQTFTAGAHSLTVKVPTSDFQVDFVCGTVITHFGCAGSNDFYTPQGRLIGSANGGVNGDCDTPWGKKLSDPHASRCDVVAALCAYVKDAEKDFGWTDCVSTHTLGSFRGLGGLSDCDLTAILNYVWYCC